MFIITANDAENGKVIFYTKDMEWTLFISSAQIFSSQEDADQEVAALIADDNCEYLIAPYALEVVDEANYLAPKLLREKIRAFGPTVQFGYPAAA